RLLAPGVAQPAQLRGRPHAPLRDIAVNHAAELGHAAGIVLDEGVGHGMRKAHAPALLVEAQQVVAKLVRLRRPQLPDGALASPLVGKYFAHDHTPSAIAALML